MAVVAPAPTFTTLFVGNLESGVVEDDLRQYFVRAHSIKVCKDEFSGTSLGYAFVNYQKRADAMSALNLDQLVINAQAIKVGLAPKCKNAEVFVKNFGRSMTSIKLHTIFSKYGTVASCKIGESRGLRFAYIHFVSTESATAALISLHLSLVEGKRIWVSNIPAQIMWNFFTIKPSGYDIIEICVAMGVIVLECTARWSMGHKRIKKNLPVGDLDGDDMREYESFCAMVVMMMAFITLVVTGVRCYTHPRTFSVYLHVVCILSTFAIAVKELYLLKVHQESKWKWFGITVAVVVFLLLIVEIGVIAYLESRKHFKNIQKFPETDSLNGILEVSQQHVADPAEFLHAGDVLKAMVIKEGEEGAILRLSTLHNPEIVFEEAEEMARKFRIADAL